MSDEEEAPSTSVFPLFSVSSSLPTPSPPPPQNLPSAPQWLSNSSFTTDLSVINNAVASRSAPVDLEDDEVEDDYEKKPQAKPSPSYELVQSSESDRESKKKRKKQKRKSRDSKERALGDYGSRKSGVCAWDNSDSKPSKDYYFDSRGDRDNLAFGSIYRMDVARYKPYDPAKGSGRFLFAGLHRRNQRDSILDGDADADALDGKLKSAGRYWSAKYAALERNRNLKRVRILAQENSSVMVPGDFIPFSDVEKSVDVADNAVSKTSVVQESWEDEVLRKTRDFNKLTREYPHNEKVWIDFAEFQDRIASMQPQKGARLQTFEKKISILEKATELNPDNEELLLALMKAYQSRDNIDVLIDRWEKILMQHSGSYKLWREFLYVVQGEFSRFKVTDMRKMYSHAIQALSAACSKQFRLINLKSHPCVDHATVQQELGLVDVFLSLCRFEWQAGYQELATALFQAEIEFSLFSPSLLLNENSKQRLFEHFWSSNGARVGEEGALGWSTWLEKEEENRQRIVKEEIAREENEKGGWTGWSEPSSKNQETSQVPENVADDGEVRTEGLDDSQEDFETEDVEEEEDTETLMKMLGIGDTGVSGEVQDLSTWIKWSEEESSRDCAEWMPLRTKNGQTSDNNGTSDMESDEQLSRVILYEDVSEHLFSLSSEEARLSLLFQFIEFFGGKISQWSSTNCSSWTEKFNSIENVPDSILDHIRRVAKVLAEIQSSSVGINLESLLGSSNDISQKIEMMKFLQNAALLCLTAFPRNHILEEAALIAEELSVTKMNSLVSSATPCRALAKRLLKSDRQDVLLCGVYARREAVFGNIDHARRVFDMALSSIEGLPPDQKSNALLIYLWYAEAEVANGSESSYRAIHILSCIGSGAAYSPYKNQPSSLQLLRAHQGFKERIKAVRSTWMRGVIDDQSVALVCSAALFEELTTGWEAGTEILDQAFMMVLPERRSQSYQLEFLYNFYVRMLQRHHKQSSLSKVWGSILQGLQVYPSSVELFNTLMETSHLYTTPNKLRWMFDQHCLKNPSVIVWLFALSFELSRGGSQHRIHGLFERALGNSTIRNSVVLWRCYIAYELNVLGNPSAARRIFFRAIHACPWSKKLWLDGFVKLNSILSAKELSDLQEVMRDKELNMRTDIYEILLRDDIVS